MEAEGPPTINIEGGVMNFNDESYIKQDQIPAIVSQASKQGEARALRRLQMSPTTCRKVWSPLMEDLAVGHFLDLNVGGSNVFNWQNFWIKENVDNYSFIPFGFSGLTTNRQGDNIDATLVFPNKELSRQYAKQATEEKWVARVRMFIFDPDDKTKRELLTSYVGQITSSRWGETAIEVNLNTIIDAVGVMFQPVV